MKKLFKSINDSNYHFSLRKMSVGVCSVILGIFFAGGNKTVKANTIEHPEVQIGGKMQQKVNKDSTLNFASSNSPTSAKEVQKGEIKNLKVTVNDQENKMMSTASNWKDTIYRVRTVPSQGSTDSQKKNFDTSDSSTDNKPRLVQRVETNTVESQNYSFESRLDATTNLLVSKAMFHYTSNTGWENINGKIYYRNSDGNYLRNQWAAPTGTTHYFGREGYIISKQWYKMPNNNIYYFGNMAIQ